MSSLRDELAGYVDATAPAPAERGALKAAVLARTRRPRRRKVALAALAAAAVGLAIFGGVSLSRTEAPPEPLALHSQEQPVVVQEHVLVQPGGEGQATPGHISWESGTVRVEVTPNRGVALEVTTEEASVRVVGTVFEVERGSFGTTVSVERGKVEVTCRDSEPRSVPAGQALRCFPSAETGAGYVVELRRRGAPPQDWLIALEAARRAPAGQPGTPAALLALEVDAWLTLSRPEEAAARVQQAMGEGTEVLERSLSALSAALVARGDCAAAVPFLQALQQRGNAEAAAWLAHCQR